MGRHAEVRTRPSLPPFLTTWLHAPGVPFTLAVLALALPALMAGRSWMVGDIWWVLKNGELLATGGTLGSSDAFTFAPHVDAVINAQWLAHLLYYWVYAVSGSAGVIGFTALLASATFAFMFHIAWRRTDNVVAAALATAAAVPVAIWVLDPRAQMFAFLLFAVTYWLLTCAPRSVPTLVALGIATTFWANAHGSFFMGPVLTGLLLSGEAVSQFRASGWRSVLCARQLRFFIAAIGVQVLASLVTPYGVDLYVYAVRLMSNSIVRNYVTEWATTSIDQPNGLCFFLSMAITLALAARARRGIRAVDVLMLVVMGTMALEAVRNVVWWALVSVPILAAGLAQLTLPHQVARVLERTSTPRQNLLRACAILLVVLAISPWLRTSSPVLAGLAPPSSREFLPPDYPIAATEFLQANSLPSRLYGDQPWGAYLDWELWPRYQLLVDASMETHPADVWMDVMAISNATESWQERLDKYQVDLLLLNPSRQAELIKAVDRSSQWQRLFSDQYALVYVRTNQMEATQ
jgi:hypothetical protein